MTKIPNYTLHNGVKTPAIAFGTWRAQEGQQAETAILDAIKNGYTHIDTAAIYANEESIGKAIKKSGVKRENLFITTKLWNTEHGYEQCKKAFQDSLDRLGLDYIDLYLIHWPNPVCIRDNWQIKNQETWQAMEELYEEGKIRAIGVSNFRRHHLESLLETAKIKPMVNQIYLNPSDQQKEVVKANNELGILTAAYTPLARGEFFDIPKLQEIAKNHNKTVPQVILRWSIQHGFLPLPKSTTPHRIKENIEIFDFNLTSIEMETIDKLQGIASQAVDPDKATN